MSFLIGAIVGLLLEVVFPKRGVVASQGAVSVEGKVYCVAIDQPEESVELLFRVR